MTKIIVALKKDAVAYGVDQLLPGYDHKPPFGVSLAEIKGGAIDKLLVRIAKTHRKTIADWALWFWGYQQRTGAMNYKQARPMVFWHPPRVYTKPGMDCSAFATLCAKLAGLDDPNGFGYSGEGDCITLMEHGTKVITPAPSDFVFYCDGAKGPGVPTHVAIAISRLEVVSMGEQGDPAKRVLHDCGGGLPYLETRRYA